MRSYSLDLRQKIVQARENQRLSIRKLAQNFGVAKSFVQKILKQYQETGNLQPLYSGGRPPKMDSEQIVLLLQMIDENNDATLSELAELFEEKTGLKLSTSTINRVSRKFDYTFKKKRYTPQKNIVREFNKKGANIGTR